MRKLFLKLSMLLFVLAMSVNAAWGQGIDFGGIDPENPATWFYVNLTAQPSTPACGTNPGQVWLRSVTPSGEDSNPYVLPDKPANPYADKGTEDWDYRQWSEEYGFKDGWDDAKNGLTEKNYRSHYDDQGWTKAVKEGYDAGWDWYKSGHYLNPVNPVGFAATASLKGYTVVYAPGFDDLMGFSAYASFYGKAQENDGWYFTGWSYTDGDSDLGVGDENGVLFRVLPAATAGETNIRNEYVYATFKPVMVSDYKVNGLINKSVSNMTTVVFDAVGQSVSASDFTVSVEEDNFSAVITSCANNKVTVTVTYSGSADGEFRGNVTLASKSGCSQLTAAVYARVGADATNEATLYDGKTPTATSGTLEAMIAAANGTNNIVVLNKNYTKSLTVNANVTLNFNGYTVQDLTVAGGEVTIAFDKYGSNGEAVSVTGGKLILNGGEFASLSVSNGAIVEQNGAMITGAATNNGTLVATEGRFEGGLTSAGTLTVNGGAFEGTTAVTVSDGTAIFNKAAISGTTTGILVSGGETTISSKLVSVYGGTNAIKQQTSGSITLLNGKFDGATPLAGTIALQGGYFKTNTPGIAIPSGKKVLNVLAGTEFAEGYRYFIGEDATGVGVCRIGTTSYATLEAALAYANNNPSQDVVIIMTNDYTLPAGYYTLPARATLIVPMSDEQETGYEIVNRVSNNSAARLEYLQPYEFRRLTFAKGVNMDVHGTIELTCTQRASDDGYAAMPYGPYGHLVMEEGSHMTLQSGSLLRAWGYMTGKGETDARRGSKVREQFQMGDWKGGGESFKMLDVNTNQGRVFPISQYFIQNIESPVKYHPGAILSTTTSVSANFGSIGVTAMANDIIIVGVSGGDPAMFFMDQEADAENTWVRKWYNAEDDVQTYDVNTGAHIGSMVLDLGKLGTTPLKMNSGMFVLPITNNMKIHLLSGSMDFTQVTSLLPGAEVEVDKESTVTIYNNPDPEVFSGALIIYDKDQWGEYANGKCIECVWNDEEQKYKDGMETGYYTKVVKYSPSWDGALVAGKPANGKPTVRHEDACPDDASINVHGTFATGDGYLLTTEGGANIFSSNEDAGSYVCSQNPPSSETLEGLYVLPINKTSAAKKLYLAKLKNADETYTETDEASMNQIFIYRDNAWQAPVKDNVQTFYFDCYTAEVDMAAYAADVAAKANNIAIYYAPDNIAECLVGMALAKQTWGTSLTPANYETMKANGLLSNYMATIQGQVASMKAEGYDLGGAVQHIYIKPQEWLEIVAQAHIKLNFDQDYIDDLEARYNNGEYNDAVNAYMEYVQDQAYNPYLEGVEGNADHTYSDADGAGRLFIKVGNDCQWWEVEKKDNLYHCIHPQNDTYYYWDEDAEMWMEKKFTITWKNWNGDIIQTADADGNPQNSYEVTYGTMAEFLGTNPTRSSNIDYTYDFTGWSPALGKVTSNVTYTASFTEKPRKYTIIFLQEGGVEIERQFLTHNEVPVCENVPTKVGHTLVWSPAIAAVTGDATYTATWEENPPTEYEITFYDYNGTTVLKQGNVNVGDMPVPPAQVNGKPATSEYTYVFDHWSPAVEKVSATSIKSYTAVYRQVAKTFPVNFYFEQQDAEHKIGATQFLEIGQTPVIPDDERLQKTEDNANVYQLVWTPQIQTVVGHAEDYTYNYVASYTSTPKQYSLTLKCTPSGAAVITGTRADYAYEATPTVTVKANTGYNFVRWSDGEPIGVPDEDGVYSRKVTINGNIELTVVCECPDCDKSTIKWMNENGKGDPLATDLVPVGSATIFHGATPEKENSLDGQYSYTFYGWTTAANEGGTKYKNGMTPVVPDVENPSDQTYTYYACFTPVTRQYNVALSSNIPNVCMLVGAGTYDYSASAENATVIVSGYDAVNYTFDGWYNGEEQVSTAESYSFAVKSDVNLVAKFSPVTYTITWKSEDGNSTLETDAEQAYGAATAFNSAEPTKEAHSFIGWTTAVNGEGSFYAKGATPAVSGDATYYAYFAENTRSLEIGADGSQTLDEPTDYTTFTITSNGVNSGQLINANNLSLLGEAIFKLQPAASIPARTWYAVAAPWQVDVRTGIYAGGRHLNVGRDFDIIEFNAESYAVNEAGEGNKNIWRYVEENGGVMQPGKLYMIYLASAQSSLEFHKTGGGISTTTLSLTTTSVGSDDTKANWNAIANPALYHADLNMTVIADASQDVLQYINGGYTPTTVSNMIVGAPVFVQVNNPQSTVNATMHSGALPAPAYRAPQAQTTDNRFVVEIARNGMMNDRLIVQTSEEKDNAYVIGKDLAKMGVGTKTAQMWISRYNTKLSKNTVEMSSDRAEYPLSIYAPAAGEYVLTAAQQRGDVELFLTRNGEAIWNLSEGDYVLSLDKGTTAQYGLRISAKAPQTATGVDEAIVDAQGETRKVLIDNKVFIIRGDKVYSVDGQLVK